MYCFDNVGMSYLTPHHAFKMFASVHINPILTFDAEIWYHGK